MIIRNRKKSNSRYITRKQRLDNPYRGEYNFRGRLFLDSMSEILLRNPNVAEFLIRAELLLVSMIDSIKFMENIYNYTKDKDKINP